MLHSGRRVAVVVFDSAGGFDGRTRALVNLAYGLADVGELTRLVLVDGKPPHLSRHDDFTIRLSRADLIPWIANFDPEIVIVDDDVGALRWVPKVRAATDASIVVYALILFGMSAVLHRYAGASRTGSSLVRNIASFAPARIMTTVYRRRLLNATHVVAVSATAAKMLRWVYGVSAAGVVHPPVTVEDYRWSASAEEGRTLLYVGSHPSDTSIALVRDVTDRLVATGTRVTVFGNNDRAHDLKRRFPDRVDVLARAPTAEVAAAYRRSSVVVCPQHWELFGYVPVEAALTGARSVNLLGAGCEDLLLGVPGVRFALSSSEFLDAAADSVNSVGRIDEPRASAIRGSICPQHSAGQLLKALR